MTRIGQILRISGAISAIAVIAAATQTLMAGPLPPDLTLDTTRMGLYLIIGTDNAEALDTSNTELGANQEAVSDATISANQRVGGTTGFGGFSSGSAPDIESHFFPGDVRDSAGEGIFVPDKNNNGTTGTSKTNNRWNDIDPSAVTGNDVVGTPDTLGVAGDGYADASPLFEPMDWSGNVANTYESGTIHTSNTDINAVSSVGIQCAGSAANCDNASVSNTSFFDGDTVLLKNTAQGLAPGTGITGGVDHSSLLTELDDMKKAIAAAIGELVIDKNISKFSFKEQNSVPYVVTDQASWNSLPGESDQNGPLIFDLDKLDKVENGGNEDGFVIIDVDVGKNAFKISESDVILKTTGDTVAIFRADGELVQFDFDDSSIMKGEDDWDKIDNPPGLEGDPITDLVAMFVVDTYNETNEVFDLDNVILGGIALYDFIDLGGEGKQTTVIDIDNGQGCVQFVSNHVDLQNTRWNRCTASFETPDDDREVPEPGTLAMFAFGIFGLAIARRRRKVS